MNYSQAEAYLYNLRLYGTKLGLNNIAGLLDQLNNPQKSLFFVHIAGTNGKGSVCAILNAILRSAGLKTAVFTSPHLISLRERFVVNNKVISAKRFVSVLKKVKKASDELKKSNIIPTFFEVVTAMAIDYFAGQQVDVVILETGMGGSLDATNIVNSNISIITNVSLDHCRYLGNTVEKIAEDKAGIIKSNQIFFTGSTDPDILSIFKKICEHRKTKMIVSDEQKNLSVRKKTVGSVEFDYIDNNVCYKNLRTRLTAPYQLKNTALAVSAARMILNKKSVDSSNVENYIRNGLRNVSIKGRFQCICAKPPVILDAAHNIAGFTVLKQAVSDCFPNYKVCLMIGILKDKDYQSVCREISSFADEIVCVEPDSARKLPAFKLRQCFKNICAESVKISVSLNSMRTVKKFIEKNHAINDKKVLIVCGSFYLVGDFLRKMGLTRLKIADKESDYR
ncbi:bifunctional folylpolyglutamate synthase/dihydrofolate synthase [bacterium]|nr:bifunctional folylpolyglutamate synthase/dihydrofolate synthase [bacterium]